jgi:hypothetical protein
MEPVKRKGFNTFDVILGIGVLAVVAAGLPWLGQQLDMAKNARSRDHAAVVAQAILDYHTEMGQWPAAHGQPVDLTLLTAVPPPTATMGTMAPPDERPWIEEVPVDSWGRPFVAAIYDENGLPSRASAAPAGGSRAYPMAPPPGATIVVVSAGHDGVLQSNLEALAGMVSPTYRGDDTGQVLRGQANSDGS